MPFDIDKIITDDEFDLELYEVGNKTFLSDPTTFTQDEIEKMFDI